MRRLAIDYHIMRFPLALFSIDSKQFLEPTPPQLDLHHLVSQTHLFEQFNQLKGLKKVIKDTKQLKKNFLVSSTTI